MKFKNEKNCQLWWIEPALYFEFLDERLKKKLFFKLFGRLQPPKSHFLTYSIYHKVKNIPLSSYTTIELRNQSKIGNKKLSPQKGKALIEIAIHISIVLLNFYLCSKRVLS